MPAAQILVASLVTRSDYPVSLAVTRAVQNQGLALCDVIDLAALPGCGVWGYVNGALYHLGNYRLIKELGVHSSALEAQLVILKTRGKTVVMLIGQDGVCALFGVTDTIKDSSRQVIKELHAPGIKTLMLSGDNPYTAEAIAQQVDIDETCGNLLPEDKQREIERRPAQGIIGTVSNGINGAPTLARADIEPVMGAAGTDTMIETTDVVLMDDDLHKLPTFVRLSWFTVRVLKRSIALVLGIKVVFLTLTSTGQVTIWMAVFTDMDASLLAVGNGLRLLRK